MSKRKSKSKAAETTPGFVRGRFAEVATLVTGSDLGAKPPELPKDVNDAVVAMVVDTLKLVGPLLPKLRRVELDGLHELVSLAHYAAAQGFALALYRYADELKRVPELAAWHRKRRDALGKGHATQTQAREAKYQRIREKWAELESAGQPCTYDAVAAACGCSRATVDRAINHRATKRPRR